MLRPCSEPYPHWLLTDPISGDALSLVPERGGLLTGWLCHGPWGGREILYFDAERFADPALSVRGGMPVLFPICGNLAGNELVLPQGRYPLSQHGFARDLPWGLDPLPDGCGVRLTLEDGPSTTRAHYPFSFRLALELRLQPGALAIEATVTHTGGPLDPPIPFAFGLQPAGAEGDRALGRELHRVAHQVHQHLLHPRGVACHRVRHVRGDVQAQGQ